MLLKKRETICLQLGSRQSLASAYWQRAEIELLRDDCLEARRLALQSLEIFRDLKMPRETDSVSKLLAKIDRQCGDQSQSTTA